MMYRETPPPPALARAVECAWTLRGPAPGAGAPPQRVLPDGCAELILNFGARFEEHRDGAREAQPLAFVVGQMERPLLIAPTGLVDLVAIRFQPDGARAVLGVPARELTGRVVPLEALDRDLAAACERARELARPETRLRVVFSALAARAARRRVLEDPAVSGALRALLATHGAARVEDLAAEAVVSRRQLERKFDEWVGLPPKRLARILRFQRVFHALEHAGGGWAAAAVDSGYYDQSHLVRDFRELAGDCPTALEVPDDSLTRLFLRRDRASHSSKTRRVG